MKFLVNAALTILTVSLCLIIGEATLRFIDRTEHSASFALLRGRHQVYRLLETPIDLGPDGERKLFVIGDSFVRGEKCGNDCNPVAQLEGRLDGSNVRAINLGVEGTTPIDYLIRFEDAVAVLGQPAAAIVVLYFNDVEISTSYCRYRGRLLPFLSQESGAELAKVCMGMRPFEAGQLETTAIRRVHSWLLGLYTWQLVREAGVRILIKLGAVLDWGRTSYFGKWTNREGIHQRLVIATLRAIQEFGAAQSIPTYFVIYPDVSSITPKNPQIGMYKSFQDSAALHGIKIRDAWPFFLRHAESTNLSWSILDEHPNCEAHALFAEFLYDILKSESPHAGGSLVSAP